MKTLYDFEAITISGKNISLSEYKGLNVLVVNTASKCGFTKQYADLQKLYEEYRSKNFVILGFPSNNFLWQEPGTNEQIASFCSLNYGVEFPMFAKINVKGKNIHPLYNWLTRKAENGVADAPVKWNFQKFLINNDGSWAGVVTPRESPYSNDIISWINNK